MAYRETSDDYDRMIAEEQGYLDHFRKTGNTKAIKDYEQNIARLKGLRKEEVARDRNHKRAMKRWGDREMKRHGNQY